MRYLKYFEGYLFEDDAWFDNWKDLPQWELLTLMGFQDRTVEGDKKKIQIIHPEFSNGILNLTKAGYIRRPGAQGFQFQFGGGTPLSEMLDHVIKRYIKKTISSVSKQDIDRLVSENPEMIDLFIELPKIQDEISSRTGVKSERAEYYKANNITPAIAKWLDNSCGTWGINHETGLIDAHHFKPKPSTSGFRGIRFGKIEGDFDCSELNLTSLEGCPHTVNGSFSIFGNSLENLKGSPQIVRMNFSVRDENLKSLEGCPQEIRGSFYCDCSKLKNLIGGPRRVEQNYTLRISQWSGQPYEIDSLEGYPEYVGRYFTLNQTIVELNPVGFLKLCTDPRSTSKEKALALPYLKDEYLDEYFKKNPLQIDLLDPHPEIKAGVLKRTGMRDMSVLARNMRAGLL